MIFKDDGLLLIIESLRDYPLSYYKRLSIIASTCITIILIIDTLTTRQILPYNNTSGSLSLILNLVIAYGIGSLDFLVMLRE